jgi:hypothetical protein
MPSVDYEWVRQQLTDSKVKRGPGDIALSLLKIWEDISIEDNALLEEGLTIFKTLALNHSLLAPYADEVWVEATPGQLKVSDVVRVKQDAFNGDTGRVHNGRLGIIVAIRYGDIIVRTTDGKQPVLDGAHYSPFHLDKRIK